VHKAAFDRIRKPIQLMAYLIELGAPRDLYIHRPWYAVNFPATRERLFLYEYKNAAELVSTKHLTSADATEVTLWLTPRVCARELYDSFGCVTKKLVKYKVSSVYGKSHDYRRPKRESVEEGKGVVSVQGQEACSICQKRFAEMTEDERDTTIVSLVECKHVYCIGCV